MDIFSALAQPTRRSIIEILADRGELSASGISHKFHVSSPAISQHLKILRDAKLVDMEKKAQQRIYTINTDSLSELEAWAYKMKRQWYGRFDRLDNLLHEIQRKPHFAKSSWDKGK